MNEVSRRLEIAFENVARTGMADMPFVNGALHVEAVGFHEWQGQWLGILVTPWSINVQLLPGTGPWPKLPAGGERFVDLPSGRFRFIVAVDAGLGEYHACSLFSPALEFQDHDAARATATEALRALLTPEATDEIAKPRALSRREFLRGCQKGLANEH